METKKLGQEPVFPMVNSDGFPGRLESLYEWDKADKFSIGISKRFYAACAAMQGMLSGKYAEMSNGLIQSSMTIKKAYELADELLKQE